KLLNLRRRERQPPWEALQATCSLLRDAHELGIGDMGRGSHSLSVFFDRKTSPSPVLDVDLVDDHERRVHGLVQVVEKKLAYALDQLCLILACRARVPWKRPLPRDLNVDDRHCTSPAGLSLIVDWKSSGPGHRSILAMTGWASARTPGH